MGRPKSGHRAATNLPDIGVEDKDFDEGCAASGRRCELKIGLGADMG
jgi:hypothetical protein